MHYLGKITAVLITAWLICVNATAGRIYRQHIAAFNAIEADGFFNIHITNGKAQYVQMKQDATPYVKIWDEGGVLHIENVDPHTGLKSKAKYTVYSPTTINISLPYLDGLYLSGNTSVIGDHIRSNGLIIEAKDNSYTLLKGVVDVNKIIMQGNSHVAIRWVNSGNLKIVACDCAQIYLAGVAQMLQAQLGNQAHMDTKYLRPRIAMIQAKDKAVADVLAIHSMYAFADDSANINYYKVPQYTLAYTRASGNVLQLARWK